MPQINTDYWTGGGSVPTATTNDVITAELLDSALNWLSAFSTHTHSITDTYTSNCQCQCNCRCRCFGNGCNSA